MLSAKYDASLPTEVQARTDCFITYIEVEILTTSYYFGFSPSESAAEGGSYITCDSTLQTQNVEYC